MNLYKKREMVEEYPKVGDLRKAVVQEVNALVLDMQEKIHKALTEKKLFIGSGKGDLSGKELDGLVHGYIYLLTQINFKFGTKYTNSPDEIRNFFEHTKPCKY